MRTHQCSLSMRCKSKDCSHAVPHSPMGCNSNAPCGCWPDNKGYQPMVICITVDQVKEPEDCPNCGKSEAKGHHPQDCIAEMKRNRIDFNQE